MKYTEEQVDSALEIMRYFKESSDGKPEFGYDLSLNFFLKIMKFLTPQSYGSRIQNKLIKSLGFSKVDQRLDKGDYKDQFGHHYEVKISLITETNNSLNMVQIRPWQEIKGYICIAIDLREDPKIYTFKLNKEEMKAECELMKASSAHGTKNAVKNNENIELRMGLKIDLKNKDFLRWKEKYLTDYEFS